MPNILFSYKVIDSEMNAVDRDIFITENFSKDDAITECRAKLLTFGYSDYGYNKLKFVYKNEGVFIEGMAFRHKETTSSDFGFLVM